MTDLVTLPPGLPIIKMAPDMDAVAIQVTPHDPSMFPTIHARFYVTTMDEYYQRGGLDAFHDMTLVRPSMIKTAFFKETYSARIELEDYINRVLAARISVIVHPQKVFTVDGFIHIDVQVGNQVFYRQKMDFPRGTRLEPGATIDQWVPMYIAGR